MLRSHSPLGGEELDGLEERAVSKSTGEIPQDRVVRALPRVKGREQRVVVQLQVVTERRNLTNRKR